MAIKPVNLIKAEQSLEVLLFIFTLADCYRRAYFDRMLASSLEPVEGIYEDEFVAVLERELQSADLRWLVPSLLRLVPGLAEIPLEFAGRQVELAEAMDFIARATKDPSFFWAAAEST